MYSTVTHEKIMSGYHLLTGATISVSSFEHFRTLVKGLHPKLDEKLEACSRALSTVQKLQSGDIITLSAESLAEDTEEKKERKKALLLWIRSIKDLRSEIERIDAEFTRASKNGNSTQSQVSALGRIICYAKGPMGVVTLVALVAVVGFSLFLKPRAQVTVSSPASSSKKVQVITYQGKQIPLNQLYVGHGYDCDSPHYHAVTGSVTALDGTVIPDPENCGYGKLKDVQASEVEVTASPSP